MSVLGLEKVALRKESVDRNINCNCNFTQKKHVALRKESVDRNQYLSGVMDFGPVALRKESVDRNPYIPLAKVRHCEVALRKESVDRNGEGGATVFNTDRRSPQGERG